MSSPPHVSLIHGHPLLGVTGAFALGGVFVGSLYLFPASRRPNYDRDAPRNVQQRLFCAAAATSVCVAGVLAVSKVPLRLFLLGYDSSSGGSSGGLRAALSRQLRFVSKAVAYTSALFAGVIVENVLDALDEAREAIKATPTSQSDPPRGAAGRDGTHPRCDSSDDCDVSLSLALRARQRWSWIRNIVVAPLLEEIVFRAGVIHIVLASLHDDVAAVFTARNARGFMLPRLAVFASGAVFSGAHVHHVYLFLTSKGWSLQRAMKACVGNLVVHFVFSLLGTFLYCSCGKGSIAAAAASHALCNYLGPPTFSFLSSAYGESSLRRVVNGVSYVGGVAAFAVLLRREVRG